MWRKTWKTPVKVSPAWTWPPGSLSEPQWLHVNFHLRLKETCVIPAVTAEWCSASSAENKWGQTLILRSRFNGFSAHLYFCVFKKREQKELRVDLCFHVCCFNKSKVARRRCRRWFFLLVQRRADVRGLKPFFCFYIRKLNHQHRFKADLR